MNRSPVPSFVDSAIPVVQSSRSHWTEGFWWRYVRPPDVSRRSERLKPATARSNETVSRPQVEFSFTAAWQRRGRLLGRSRFPEPAAVVGEARWLRRPVEEAFGEWSRRRLA